LAWLNRFRRFTVRYERYLGLLGPLQAIVGLGDKHADVILAERAMPSGPPLPRAVQALLATPRTAVDTLWPVRDLVQRQIEDTDGTVTISDVLNGGLIEDTPENDLQARSVCSAGAFGDFADDPAASLACDPALNPSDAEVGR
jgi:hypothetical protein